MTWDNVYRLGCEVCGERVGCRCNDLRSCTRCGGDYFFGEGEDGVCHECIEKDELARMTRHSPADACDALDYAVRKGKLKPRAHQVVRFIPLTHKQKEMARRLVHLMVWGDYGY